MRKLRTFGLLLTGILGLLLLWPAAASAGGGGGGPCSGFGSGEKVALRDSCFDQTALFVKAGTQLLVTNDGHMQHSFTAVDGSFDTGLLEPGQTARVTVGQAGLVRVYCTIHGTASGQGMAGLVVIGEPDLGSAAGGGLSAEAKGAIDQQTALLMGEIDARTAAQTDLNTRLAAMQQQLDTLQSARWSGAALLGLLGSVLGVGALAAVYYRRRPATS